MRSILFTSVLASLATVITGFTPEISAPGLTIGTDGPQDPATLGYTHSHQGLLVTDLNVTAKFYGDVLGMRKIFTYEISDEYSFMYMGYTHGGKNGTGFQTGEEMFTEQRNIEGMIEFIWTKNATINPKGGFSHLAIVVPDINALQDRLEAKGVPILKKTGETGNTTAVAEYMGYPLGSDGQFPDNLGAIFNPFLFATDPDGYLIEFQPQSGF